MATTADMPRRAAPGSGPMALLFRREVAAKLVSAWFYVVASAVCLIAWFYGMGFQNAFRTESVLVTADPLMGLNVTIIAFMGLVLGLRLSTGIAWEREHGTLEVLLSGPLTWGAIVAAKFLVELCVLALLTLIYLLYLVLGQPLGAGVIAPAETLSIGLLLVFVLPLMALGLAISAWAASVRAAVVIFLVLVGVLAAYEGTRTVLQAMPVETMSLTLLYVRTALEAAEPVVHPVSAVGQLAELAQMAGRQVPLRPRQVLLAAALTIATLLLAWVIARRRGWDDARHASGFAAAAPAALRGPGTGTGAAGGRRRPCARLGRRHL